MNEKQNPPFPTSEEVARTLVDELQGLRTGLREFSAKLTRIEKRVYHVFPKLAPPKRTGKCMPKADEQDTPTLTSEQVMTFYDDLVPLASSNKKSDVLERLGTHTDANLRLLLRELGVSLGSKKPTRKNLIEGIMQRLKESVLLTRHTERPKDDFENVHGNPGLPPI